MERQPENIDPTKVSIIDSRGIKKIESYHVAVFEDQYGRRLYGGENFPSGANQMLLTRLVKGIIPVSDVVCDEKGLFYSYETPLNFIDENNKNPNGDNEICDMIYGPVYSASDHQKADNLILFSVFADYDHRGSSNVRNLPDGRYCFYDFCQFGRIFWNKELVVESFWGPNIENIEKELKNFSSGSIEFLKKQLDQLLNRVKEQGHEDFLMAVIKSIPKESGVFPSVIENAPGESIEEKINSFRNELIERIHNIKNALLSFGGDVKSF